MSKYDFSRLYERYPALIAAMPPTFTSHEFILRLARENQALYVDALHHYREAAHRGSPAPFMCVHTLLAMHLSELPHLVESAGCVASKDIFGQPSECTRWRKVH